MKQMKERNNSGFTLVELLLAITILGIIVAPFMHSFVTASRTNAKAQQIQNATLLATNIMEEVKANSAGDLAFQFNYPSRYDGSSRFDVVNTYSSVYELVMEGGSLENVVQYAKNATGDNREFVTASVLYEDYVANTSDSYEYLGQELGKYYYVMEGLTSGKTEYDALITLDSNGYKSIDNKGYNDQKTPIIESLDVLEDAFFVQPKNTDSENAQLLAEKAGLAMYSTLMDGDLTNGEMAREITIDIEQDGTLTRAYATYKYTYGSYEESTKYLIYNNAESPTYSLKSLYLFYLPHYSSTGASVLDKIIINNNDNVDATVYLVKQRQVSANTGTLIAKEAGYQCEVTVKENVSSFYFSTHDAHIDLRTNLGTNLYNPSSNVPTQAVYKYGGANSTPTTNQYVKQVLELNALDGSEAKDRIYEVTVSIYKAGEADTLFTGDPVATITGSKDN